MCKTLRIPLSGHQTKPQLTRKIKEVQAEREPLRQETLDFGRHRGKTYEWVRTHDQLCCEWAVLTVVEEGATASPQLKKFATHVEQSLVHLDERCTIKQRSWSQRKNSQTSRNEWNIYKRWFDKRRLQRSPMRPVQQEDDEWAATSDVTEEWKTNSPWTSTSS